MNFHPILNLKKIIQYQNSIYSNLTDDIFRYSSLNPCAIRTFGSIEFRGMRSITKAEELITWSNIIQKIIDFQEKHGSIDNIIKNFKHYSPTDIVIDIFKEHSTALLKTACNSWQDEMNENFMKVVHFRNSLFTWDIQELTGYYEELCKNRRENDSKDYHLKRNPIKPLIRKMVIDDFIIQDEIAYIDPIPWEDPEPILDRNPVPKAPPPPQPLKRADQFFEQEKKMLLERESRTLRKNQKIPRTKSN